MLTFNPLSALTKAITRGMTPKQARQMIVPLDFSTDTSISVNINVSSKTLNAAQIDGIQSMFVDNSNNPQSTTITTVEGNVFVAPAYAQTMFPYLFSGEALNFVASSTGGVLVRITFLNTREQAAQWSTQTPIGGVVNVTGSVVKTQPAVGGFTDASAVATGVDQILVASNGNRKLVAVKNPASPASQNIAAAESVFVNFAAAAQLNGATSWELLPGESLPQFLMTTTDAIHAIAATPGHQIISKWM
jgi:hypothetical protein